MNGIGIILRQYGYKGPSISSPKSAVIVEQEEGEEGSIQDNDDESNENSNDDDDTSEKENMNKTVCSDGGGSAEPSIPEEAVDEEAEAEVSVCCVVCVLRCGVVIVFFLYQTMAPADRTAQRTE